MVGSIATPAVKIKRPVKKLVKLAEEVRVKKEPSTHHADLRRQLAVKKGSTVKSLKRARKDSSI